MTAARPISRVERMVITGSVLAAAVMISLDATIAAVALPQVAGGISASADEVTWMLTSYIVATAIMTPLTGWLTARFGRKRVLIVSIAAFTIVSALCGAATSLPELIFFRVLQGAFGAFPVPLSQAVLLDIYPPEEQGKAMSLWSVGLIVGPIAGPALGGWLTEVANWRWVFYINLPIGLLALLGVLRFADDHSKAARRPLDFFGFALLSVAICASQLLLDRGTGQDWFSSTEIWIYLAIGVAAFAAFVGHTITARSPFLPRALARDRNFVTVNIFGFCVGLFVLSSISLLSPMMQVLLGYPVEFTGWIVASRGISMMIAMFMVPALMRRFDVRLIMLVGLIITAYALHMMTRLSLQMDYFIPTAAGLIQGFGMGLIYAPMTILAFATLDPSLRPDGAAIFAVLRNMGYSVGVSISQAFYVANSQASHAAIVGRLTPENPVVGGSALPAPYSLTQPAGLEALNAEVDRQASMVAYVDGHRLMFFVAVALILLLPMMRAHAPAKAPAK